MDYTKHSLKALASEAAIGIALSIKLKPAKWEGGENEDETVSLYNAKVGLVVYDKKEGTFTITNFDNECFPLHTSKDKGLSDVIEELDSAFAFHSEWSHKQTAINIIKQLEKL
jgi:hypothetical protein